jgi:hypothetical protein
MDVRTLISARHPTISSVHLPWRGSSEHQGRTNEMGVDHELPTASALERPMSDLCETIAVSKPSNDVAVLRPSRASALDLDTIFQHAPRPQGVQNPFLHPNSFTSLPRRRPASHRIAQAGTSSFADPSCQRPMTARADIRAHRSATAAPQRQSSAQTRDDATASLSSGTPALPHSIHSASQHPACATCAYAQLLRIRARTNQEGTQSAQVSGEHRRVGAVSHERSVRKKKWAHTLAFSAHALHVLPKFFIVVIYIHAQ